MIVYSTPHCLHCSISVANLCHNEGINCWRLKKPSEMSCDNRDWLTKIEMEVASQDLSTRNHKQNG